MIDIHVLLEKCSFLHDLENGTELAIAWITQGYSQLNREQQVFDEDKIVDISNRNRDEILRSMRETSSRDREEILRSLPLHLTTKLETQLQERLRPLEEALCSKVPARKGATGENLFTSWMKDVKDWETECTSHVAHSGDYIHFHYDTHKQVITDVKNYAGKVTRKEIDKLWNDMTTQNIYLGLMVSLQSRITNKREPVDIEFHDVRGKRGVMMFVSNATEHKDWIRICLELLRIQSTGQLIKEDTIQRIETAVSMLKTTTALVDKLQKDQQKTIDSFKQELQKQYSEIERLLTNPG